MTDIRTFLHRVHAPSKAESGQAMVETAASAMVLATLLMGGIDVGRYTYDGMILGNAARAGVHVPRLRPRCSDGREADSPGVQ